MGDKDWQDTGTVVHYVLVGNSLFVFLCFYNVSLKGAKEVFWPLTVEVSGTYQAFCSMHGWEGPAPSRDVGGFPSPIPGHQLKVMQKIMCSKSDKSRKLFRFHRFFDFTFF